VLDGFLDRGITHGTPLYADAGDSPVPAAVTGLSPADWTELADTLDDLLQRLHRRTGLGLAIVAAIAYAYRAPRPDHGPSTAGWRPPHHGRLSTRAVVADRYRCASKCCFIAG
jgi:hypothetical protein